MRSVMLPVRYFFIIPLISSIENAENFPSNNDWLLYPSRFKSIFQEIGGNTLRLSNGLIQRDFLTTPNFGTIDLFSKEEDVSILRHELLSKGMNEENRTQTIFISLFIPLLLYN